MLKKKQKKNTQREIKPHFFLQPWIIDFNFHCSSYTKILLKKLAQKISQNTRDWGGGILSAPFNKFSIVNKYLIFGLDLTLEGLKILWLHSIKTKSYIGRSDTIKFLLWMDYKLASQNEQYAMLSLITTSFKSETPVSWTPLYFANKYMSSRNWRDK